MKTSISSRKRPKRAPVSMFTRSFQGLFSAPDTPASSPAARQRRGDARGQPARAEPNTPTLTALDHLQQALDDLPQGRHALRQLHAVEVELARARESLSNLGQAVLGSALCQLSYLQCRKHSDELERLRPALEQAVRDARARRPVDLAGNPDDQR
jgi:hypothetical protein